MRLINRSQVRTIVAANEARLFPMRFSNSRNIGASIAAGGVKTVSDSVVAVDALFCSVASVTSSSATCGID